MIRSLASTALETPLEARQEGRRFRLRIACKAEFNLVAGQCHAAQKEWGQGQEPERPAAGSLAAAELALSFIDDRLAHGHRQQAEKILPADAHVET
jgi:hypothetical protein